MDLLNCVCCCVPYVAEPTRRAIKKLEEVADHANRSIAEVANTEKLLKVRHDIIDIVLFQFVFVFS